MLMTPYVSINISYMIAEGINYEKTLILFVIGLFVFFVFYNSSLTKDSRNPNFDADLLRINESLLAKVYIFIFFCLLVLNVLSLFSSLHLFYKAIKLSIGNVLFAIFYGLFFCILSFSKKLFSVTGSLLLLILIILLNNLSATSVSRFSILQLLFFVSIAFYFRYRKCFVLNRPLYGVLLFFVAVLNYYLLTGNLTFGGDSLILSGASEVIEFVDATGKYEPLMPFFNAGGILIPDYFWSFFYDKPKAFNSSSFYIEHVMGFSPDSYPWGVGISSFGAGYVYGGYLGVVLLFVFFSLLYAKLYNNAKDPYSCGVVVYMNLLLVFAMIRMDETFILGSWLISIPILFYASNYIKSRIFYNIEDFK
ncbi:O-antigen polymerase [Aeromonas dhakensis]|uniref:O-antigen polymerase n=1 Tax=Aeromonas dhakensis TaxID=196024 RepID=UPI0039874A5D